MSASFVMILAKTGGVDQKSLQISWYQEHEYLLTANTILTWCCKTAYE
jgi:hypothetical protein